jgi:hypothetical protein
MADKPSLPCHDAGGVGGGGRNELSQVGRPQDVPASDSFPASFWETNLRAPMSERFPGRPSERNSIGHRAAGRQRRHRLAIRPSPDGIATRLLLNEPATALRTACGLSNPLPMGSALPRVPARLAALLAPWTTRAPAVEQPAGFQTLHVQAHGAAALWFGLAHRQAAPGTEVAQPGVQVQQHAESPSRAGRTQQQRGESAPAGCGRASVHSRWSPAAPLASAARALWRCAGSGGGIPRFFGKIVSTRCIRLPFRAPAAGR